MLTQESTRDADIRPISDLRNKFAEIANYVQDGNTVIFTRNGYGCMVTMSFDSYKHMTDPVVRELNEADRACASDPRHYTRDESLAILKSRMRNRRAKVHAWHPPEIRIFYIVHDNIMEVRWFRYGPSQQPLVEHPIFDASNPFE